MRWRLAVIALCLAATGCAGARRRSDTTLVRAIRFEGLDGFVVGRRTPHALREHMVQGASGSLVLTWPFNLVIRPVLFRPHVLGGDTERLSTWLGHQGWFAANVSFDVEQVRPDRRKKAGVVDVIARIERGERTYWAGPPILDGALPVGLPEDLARAGTPRAGRPFRLADAVEGATWIGQIAGDLGHAGTDVAMDLAVDLGTRAATVRYTIDPGVPSRFAAIRSTLDAPDDVVAQIADLRPGERFNATRLDQARDDLLGAGVFDGVDVRAVVEGGAAVPEVSGRRGPPRHVTAGGRFGVIDGLLRPELHAGWTHDDLLGGLQRFDVRGDVGLALPVGSPRVVPVAGMRVHLLVRNPGGPAVEPTVRVEQRLFQYALPRLDAAAELPIRGEVARRLTLELNPELRLTRLGLAPSPLWIAALGPDAVGSYGVGGLGLAATLDRTRPVVERLSGVWARVGLDGHVTSRGQPLLGGHADLRVYGAPRRTFLGRPVQLLARAELRGVASPEPVPWPERLFLGGSSDFRGFRSAGVGGYDTVCTPSPFSYNPLFDPDGAIDRIYVPHGGQARALVGGELELQRLGSPELHGAVFAEAGWLDTAGVRGAVGVGVRYATGVGPLRIDVSLRPLAAEDVGPGFGGPGTNLCDAGIRPRRRAFDLLSEFGRYRQSERTFPAVNLFFSLGRAF